MESIGSKEFCRFLLREQAQVVPEAERPGAW